MLPTEECVPGVIEADLVDKAATYHVHTVVSARSNVVETTAQWTLQQFGHGFCARNCLLHLAADRHISTVKTPLLAGSIPAGIPHEI